MGDILLIRDGMPDLLPMLHRSPGVHISQIIHYMCVKLGHYAAREPGVGFNHAQLELGNAFEHAIVQRMHLAYPEQYAQLGELECDGLFGTPDLVNLEHDIIEELKCTWMSASRDVEEDKFWRYWVQIQAYLYMMSKLTGTWWLVGRLHVLFVNGDYKDRNGKYSASGQGGPVYRVWQQRFTVQELQENWRLLVNHAQYVEPETGQPRKLEVTS